MSACPPICADAGYGYVPQGREIFPLLGARDPMTGYATRPRAERVVDEEIFSLFPVLIRNLGRRGGDLPAASGSGAIGRALGQRPKLLILDEPTEGIQPSIIEVSAGTPPPAPQGRHRDPGRGAISRVGARHRQRLRGDRPRRRGVFGARARWTRARSGAGRRCERARKGASTDGGRGGRSFQPSFAARTFPANRWPGAGRLRSRQNRSRPAAQP